MDDLTDLEHDYDPSTLENDDEEGGEEPRGLPSWIAPLALAALVVGLVVVAIARDQPPFDPTSPEGAVQEYLTAVKEHRWTDAEAVLDPEIYQDCDLESIFEPFEPFTAVHQRTYESAGQTYVEVMIRQQGGGIFGGTYDEQTVFALVQIDRHWYISEAGWPWFVWQCAAFR